MFFPSNISFWVSVAKGCDGIGTVCVYVDLFFCGHARRAVAIAISSALVDDVLPNVFARKVVMVLLFDIAIHPIPISGFWFGKFSIEPSVYMSNSVNCIRVSCIFIIFSFSFLFSEMALKFGRMFVSVMSIVGWCWN